MSDTTGRMVAPIVVIAGAILAMLVLAASPAQAAHGGEIPTYGDGTDCVLVNFTYDDGHTDHFYACGFGNDLTPEDVPDLHVMELHVSCSDVFPDGEFEKGDPTSAEAPSHEHTVARYRIVHYKNFGTETEEIDKQCGEEFVPLTVDVCVELVNDASGDGTYSDDETADEVGADAPERVTVTNCGDESHVIDSVSIGGEDVCADLLGMVQAPGESLTCDLVQPDHTPPAGEIQTDTVTVDVHHPDDETVTATDDDPTAMTTVIPSTPPVDVCVELVNDASGDGTYSDDETADEVGADVPERVTVTNCGDEPHVIDSVSIGGEDVCADLLGMVQAPGESLTCDLVQPDHTPAVGAIQTDTVTVDVHHPDDETVTATDDDPTAMTTVGDTSVAAAGDERDDDTTTAPETQPQEQIAAAELPATGARAELGLTGTGSLVLGMLLVLGATPIVRQTRYARDDIRRAIRGS